MLKESADLAWNLFTSHGCGDCSARRMSQNINNLTSENMRGEFETSDVLATRYIASDSRYKTSPRILDRKQFQWERGNPRNQENAAKGSAWRQRDAHDQDPMDTHALPREEALISRFEKCQRFGGGSRCRRFDGLGLRGFRIPSRRNSNTAAALAIICGGLAFVAMTLLDRIYTYFSPRMT